ncbi:MAG: VCBS repeat-containing protein, partial [Planctomycetales bacterium]|nr:VCBS repeat-containing protein [Planctomycetales bacterium]
MKKLSFGIALIVATLLVNGVLAQSAIQFSDVSAQTGINFLHTDGSTGEYFLIESMASGLSLLDFDEDGDLDIYFLNGAVIGDRAKGAPASSNALYRNDGNFQFSDVTNSAVALDHSLSLGVVAADYDNDGFQDIYVNNYGPNRLFHNNGDGTYTEVTQFAGVANGNQVGGGTTFFDMDNDGDLDLYVGNYIRFDPTQQHVHIHKGRPAYPSPLSFEPVPDNLFENLGNGTFRDVSELSGIGDWAGRSMGIVAFDMDNDEDTDVFVANDTQENFLFQNDGRGVFQEVGLISGIAFDFRGQAQASMGVDILDANQDQLMDLYVTSFSEEFSTLYINLGDGLFEDATLRMEGGLATFPHVTWGVCAADFDNDGFTDLVIGTGGLDDQHAARGGTSRKTGYRIQNLLLRGMPDAKFEDLESRWEILPVVNESTRGVAVGDLDLDGRVDIVCLNSRAKPTILRNTSQVTNLATRLRAIGVNHNRDGIGVKYLY